MEKISLQPQLNQMCFYYWLDRHASFLLPPSEGRLHHAQVEENCVRLFIIYTIIPEHVLELNINQQLFYKPLKKLVKRQVLNEVYSDAEI